MRSIYGYILAVILIVLPYSGSALADSSLLTGVWQPDIQRTEELTNIPFSNDKREETRNIHMHINMQKKVMHVEWPNTEEAPIRIRFVILENINDENYLFGYKRYEENKKVLVTKDNYDNEFKIEILNNDSFIYTEGSQKIVFSRTK